MKSHIARFSRIGASSLFIVLFSILTGCGHDIGNVVNYDRDARKTGLKLYNDGEYAAAAGSFKAATKTEPRDYKAYYWMGACYDALKNYNQAVSSYKSSLSVMDMSFGGSHDKEFRSRVLDALAIAIAKSDARAQEMDQMEKEAHGKQSVEAYYLIAKTYRYSRDADGALDNYNRAILLDPDNFPITREYGLYLEQLGQTQKAESMLRRAYALNSRDEQTAAALRRLGVVPGPAIKDQNQLARPVIPQGPIPELRLRDIENEPSRSTPSASTDTGPRD